MSAFPEQAKVVIIGLSGIVGASAAHHLIVRGWDDIVGIDKSGIPTDIGSTAHQPLISAPRPYRRGARVRVRALSGWGGSYQALPLEAKTHHPAQVNTPRSAPRPAREFFARGAGGAFDPLPAGERQWAQQDAAGHHHGAALSPLS